MQIVNLLNMPPIRVAESGLRLLHCNSDLYRKSRTNRLENRKMKKRELKKKKEGEQGGKRKKKENEKEKKKKKKGRKD